MRKGRKMMKLIKRPFFLGEARRRRLIFKGVILSMANHSPLSMLPPGEDGMGSQRGGA